MIVSSVLSAAAFTANAPAVSLEPRQLLGIPLALAGAIMMSFGTQYQSRGLNKVEHLTGVSAASGLNLTHLFRLLSRPSWLFGTLMLGAAVALQIGSLALSPLIIVQPLGVIALIATALLNSRLSNLKLSRRIKAAITMCVTGIFVFVAVAALTAQDSSVSSSELSIIFVIFAAAVVALLVYFVYVRHRGYALFYIIGAGVLFGFVATFAKVILVRTISGNWGAPTWIAIASLAVGALLGMLFVQNAHASGPPDLVIAGLTVIDPIVAVLIGVLVMGEARNAPVWALVLFMLSGTLAAVGVFGISKFHPQMNKAREFRERNRVRSSLIESE